MSGPSRKRRRRGVVGGMLPVRPSPSQRELVHAKSPPERGVRTIDSSRMLWEGPCMPQNGKLDGLRMRGRAAASLSRTVALASAVVGLSTLLAGCSTLLAVHGQQELAGKT